MADAYCRAMGESSLLSGLYIKFYFWDFHNGSENENQERIITSNEIISAQPLCPFARIRYSCILHEFVIPVFLV